VAGRLIFIVPVVSAYPGRWLSPMELMKLGLSVRQALAWSDLRRTYTRGLARSLHERRN